MRVGDEMRAHRVAIACALAVVLIGAIVVAVTRSGADSSASSVAFGPSAAQPFACHVTRPNGSAAPGEGPSDAFYGSRGLWTRLPLDGVLRIHDLSGPARRHLREDLPRRLAEHQGPVVGIEGGTGEAHDPWQAA
jgi:hypothetical protein